VIIIILHFIFDDLYSKKQKRGKPDSFFSLFSAFFSSRTMKQHYSKESELTETEWAENTIFELLKEDGLKHKKFFHKNLLGLNGNPILTERQCQEVINAVKEGNFKEHKRGKELPLYSSFSQSRKKPRKKQKTQKKKKALRSSEECLASKRWRQFTLVSTSLKESWFQWGKNEPLK
jgi:hypothetical protein